MAVTPLLANAWALAGLFLLGGEIDERSQVFLQSNPVYLHTMYTKSCFPRTQ